MSIVSARPTVTTSASVIATNSLDASGGDFESVAVLLKNMTATKTSVYLGGSGVTTGTGFEWEAGDSPLALTLEPGESLYGIVASGTQTIHTLRSGR